jgi:photosystem II stability/assembly factor-like uncharacterized protein
MKAFQKTLCITLLSFFTGAGSLNAQWDTIKNFTSNPGPGYMSDIFFTGSTGYAVGHEASASSYYYRTGVISKTTDGGLNWTAPAQVYIVGGDTVVDLRSVYFTTPNTGYVVARCRATIFATYYYGAVLKTTDGGSTWTSILNTRNQINTTTGTTILFNSIQFTSLYTGFVAASNQTTYDLSSGANTGSGLIYFTTNGGNNWTSSTTSNTSMACSVFFNNSGTGCVAGGVTVNNFGAFSSTGDHYRLDITQGEIARSTDWGNTWTTTYTDPSNGVSDIYFPSNLVGYAITSNQYGNGTGQVLKTTNGGQTWNAVHTFSSPYFAPRCVFFINDTTGFIGGWGEYTTVDVFYKTTDGGSTWIPQTYPSISNYYPRIVSITATTPVTYYALSDTAFSSTGYTSSVLGDFPASSCSVFLGPDTTYCQQAGQLNATPGTPGSDYIFSWSPGTGLSDSTIQNPVVMHASNQQYVVTMTDTVTNCTATDTLVVSAYNPVWGPYYFCTGDSVLLDFGPGASMYNWQFFTDTAGNTSSIGAFTQTIWATEPGTYFGLATFGTCGALTSGIPVIDTCATPLSCSVDAGPAIFSCGGPMNYVQMNPTTSPGNFNYSWSPVTGLSNPYIADPFVNDVINVTYTLTVTNTATGCTASDTVSATVYTYHYDTLYTCNNQPVTAYVGPGANYYNWSNGDSLFYTSLYVPGTYTCIAGYSQCATTSMFIVIDSCNVPVGNVWPGDCNYDLIANAADALHIGLAYGATGATRPNATPLWYAQPMADWSQNFANCNYKHADADGNGVVDANDTLPIYYNYGQTHPFRMMPQQQIASAPTLELVANYDTCGLQTFVTIDIRFGNSSAPVDSIYGISFRINSDAGLIDTALTVTNFNSTWLGTPGTDMFHFQKTFLSAGVVDIAEVGTDHVNRLNGQGSIGTLGIVTTDNLSGIAICYFWITDVHAVTIDGQYIQVNVVNDSVVIDPAAPVIVEENPTPEFSMYPNPATNNLTVKTSNTPQVIEICDMTGRVISSTSVNGNVTTINIENLAGGIYLVRVIDGTSVSTQKLTIEK